MRRYGLAFLSLIAFLLAGQASAQERALKFDFGWKEIQPPEGFVKVTKECVYTNTVGWGFVQALGWGSYPFPPAANGGHKHLDPLSRDGIRLYVPFIVDVTNGDYLVWYREGDLGAYALGPIWDHVGYGLTIGDNQAHKPVPWDKERFLKEFFRGVNDDYRRGEDVFDRYVAPLMDDQTVAVTVTNGRLRIVGEGINLCGLMIYPAAQKASFEAEVARLRQVRHDFFSSVVKVKEPTEQVQAAPVSDTDRQRGYQIWPRHKMRPVGPNTSPEADELGDTLKLYAAQDQTETVTFAVRPLVDLKTVKLTVSDLVSADGAKIAGESVAARILFYRVGPDGSVVRSHLPAFTSADLPKAITKQFWLTIPVPATAKPGIYAGQVTFTPAGQPAATLALKVKVLGFALRDVYRDAQFVMQDSHPALYFAPYQFGDKFAGEDLPATVKMFRHLKSVGLLPQLADMAARTVNYATPTQQVVVAEAALKLFSEEVEAYRDTFPGVPLVVALHRAFSGYWTPMNRGANNWPLSQQPPHHWTALKEYLEAYVKLRARHPDWPEFYYVVGAEMANGGEDHVLFGKKCIEVAKSIPGFKVITCPNGVFEARTYAPLVDVIAPNYAVPMSDPAFKGIPNEKTKLWIYQAFNRFCYGFYAERVKAGGSFKEFYSDVSQRPYNEFDGADLWVNVALPTPDGQVSMPLMEEFGWGVTDFRYIQTLKETIAKAKAGGKAGAVSAAREAEDFLASLIADINPDLDYYLNQAGFWDYSVYDTYRWQVAEHILKIQDRL